MKDNFSGHADLYAKFRPVYPQDLIKYIVGLVGEKELAWDCATGNGQTAKELSPYFKKVFATDISSNQLANAFNAENIKYAVEAAEHSSLKNGSVDLITISQALHWFNFEAFYQEVKRVSKPGAIIAAWTYNLLKTDPVTDEAIRRFYSEKLSGYWDAERKYVDDCYNNIPFPFEPIADPGFSINLLWEVDHLEGYLNTWSAVRKFIQLNNYNPVDSLMEEIKQNWPSAEQRSIVFPVYLKTGRVF